VVVALFSFDVGYFFVRRNLDESPIRFSPGVASREVPNTLLDFFLPSGSPSRVRVFADAVAGRPQSAAPAALFPFALADFLLKQTSFIPRSFL